VSNGTAEKSNIDHVINMAEWYKIILETTDLATRIADYHKISLERLSQPLDDNARVFCSQSGFVARSDYHRWPERFQLDVEAHPEDQAYLNDGHGNLQKVQVIGETAGSYTVCSLQGEEHIITNKELVEKIGGHLPINTVLFIDGSQVSS
jgi:hypothetical protein